VRGGEKTFGNECMISILKTLERIDISAGGLAFFLGFRRKLGAVYIM